MSSHDGLILYETTRGTTHAVWSFMPRTLCGKAVQPAWQPHHDTRHVDESVIDCGRCRAVALRVENFRHRGGC